MASPPAPRATRRRRVVLLAAATALLAALALAGLAALRGEDGPGTRLVPPDGPAPEGFEDPYAFSRDREDEFAGRAARGHAHVLYAKSPGGATATAGRVARWRPLVEDAAAEGDVDPDLLEAIVLLESAGRPEALAGGIEDAAGLTQILAGTGRDLLGMRVDTARSGPLLRRLARAERRGREGAARRLRRALRRVDERFDPAAALAATVRYLGIAREELGRDDLAVVSYHMGIGNLQGVLAAYGEDDVSYTEVFFASTPTEHARAHRRLQALSDDSATYLWRVHAAREILRLHREDPVRLAELEALHGNKNSAEEVLHPAQDTEAFTAPEELEAAWDAGEVVGLPRRPARWGLALDRGMGELAPRLGRRPSLYRGLRPEAMALLLYTSLAVREITGDDDARLVVSSTVRDARYQRSLARRNPEATQAYSLHTTGWAVDVLREYASREQALAFQFVLDRLQSLDLIAWVREPAAIHLTAGPDARRLLPLLEGG